MYISRNMDLFIHGMKGVDIGSQIGSFESLVNVLVSLTFSREILQYLVQISEEYSLISIFCLISMFCLILILLLAYGH